jgi:hypothetical protein
VGPIHESFFDSWVGRLVTPSSKPARSIAFVLCPTFITVLSLKHGTQNWLSFGAKGARMPFSSVVVSRRICFCSSADLGPNLQASGFQLGRVAPTEPIFPPHHPRPLHPDPPIPDQIPPTPARNCSIFRHLSIFIDYSIKIELPFEQFHSGLGKHPSRPQPDGAESIPTTVIQTTNELDVTETQ